jgi:Domain of unknown function (DUF2017)
VKVSRRGVDVRVRLDRAEMGVLAAVLLEFEEALPVLNRGDAVYDRLHPAAYADPDEAREFAELVDGEADRARAVRVARCRDELACCAGDLRLDPDAVERWLVAVNDVRLALGTRLGVTADNDPDDPAYRTDSGRMLYHWLTWLQDALVSVVLK